MLTCQHCGSKGRIMVQTVITAPSDLFRQFSKKHLRSKDVQTHGTLWETCDFICGNEACGRVTKGYGNYVTKLEKRVKELEATLATAKNQELDAELIEGKARVRFEPWAESKMLPPLELCPDFPGSYKDNLTGHLWIGYRDGYLQGVLDEKGVK